MATLALVATNTVAGDNCVVSTHQTRGQISEMRRKCVQSFVSNRAKAKNPDCREGGCLKETCEVMCMVFKRATDRIVAFMQLGLYEMRQPYMIVMPNPTPLSRCSFHAFHAALSCHLSLEYSFTVVSDQLFLAVSIVPYCYYSVPTPARQHEHDRHPNPVACALADQDLIHEAFDIPSSSSSSSTHSILKSPVLTCQGTNEGPTLITRGEEQEEEQEEPQKKKRKKRTVRTTREVLEFVNEINGRATNVAVMAANNKLRPLDPIAVSTAADWCKDVRILTDLNFDLDRKLESAWQPANFRNMADTTHFTGSLSKKRDRESANSAIAVIAEAERVVFDDQAN